MKEYIKKSMSFARYEELINDLLANGKTTGPNQSESMVGFTRLNRQRMERLMKTVVIGNEVKAAAADLNRDMLWLVITEAWCGDAAQNIPVIEKIASETGRIQTRYLLRDENPELIDRFLTNGSRSIPKLIALDAQTNEVLGTWGARPAAAQNLFETRRSEGIAKPQVMEELQRWYNADRSQSLQREFVALIEKWGATGLARVTNG